MDLSVHYIYQELAHSLLTTVTYQILEAFTQRVGFRPGETHASHARTRFRLVPSNVPSPNAPQVDASLWLVHYGQSQQPMPIDMLPIPPAMHQIMAMRQQLQRGGQVARKDFMLADRVSWPTINPPREGRGHPMMVQAGQNRNVPQQMAYPPPSKRSKTAAHAQQHMVPVGAHFMPFDDDEDTHAGDMFDHMTPRDVSMARYTRNHEWMEEVLGSAYRIGQITPADLGLGLQGELSSLTQGIFEASGVDAHKKPPAKPVVGHLDPDLAEQFRKRVAEKIEADEAEMAKMKAQHEQSMNRFKINSILSRSEKEVRVAIEEVGPEFWRLEGKEEDDEDSSGQFASKHQRKVDEIVADVESALGRHIEVIRDVQRVQDGGYQEPAPEPEPQPAPPAAPTPSPDDSTGPGQLPRPPSHAGSQNNGDVDMGGTVFQMPPGSSFNSTPQPQPSGVPSSMATPGNVPGFPSHTGSGQTAPGGGASVDVTMQDTDQAKDSNTAPDQGTGSGDWVVVPKGGVSPGTSGPDASAPAPSTAPPEASHTPSDVNKPGGSDFGDLNTAGEALSSYDQHNDGDMGDAMDLGVEDSAFGDAVFGVEESRGSAANTPAEGGL